MSVNLPFTSVFICSTNITCPSSSVSFNVISTSASPTLFFITVPDIVMSSSAAYSVLSNLRVISPFRVYPFGFRPVYTVHATFIAYGVPSITYVF